MNLLTKKDWDNMLANNPEMISAIRYGSSLENLKKAKDIDLFLVYVQKPTHKTSTYKNKFLFDINQASVQETYSKIQAWDIDFTEPFLTGETIKGLKDTEKNVKDYLLNNKPTSQAIEYIKKRSIESLIQTEQLLAQTKYELLINKVNKNQDSKTIKQDILRLQEQNITVPSFSVALNQLNYALSYAASAKRYEKKQAPITFNDLINNPENKIEELLLETRTYQKDKSPKNLQDFVQYYKKAEGLIKR